MPASLLVFFPARARNVAAHDAFYGQWRGLLDQHAAAFELITVDVGFCREVTDLGRNNVVWNNVGHLVEPEDRKLVENLTFFGDAFIHDDIKSGQAIGGDDQKILTKIEDVADFAAINHLQGRHVAFKDNSAHDHFSLLIRSCTLGAMTIVAALRSSSRRFVNRFVLLAGENGFFQFFAFGFVQQCQVGGNTRFDFGDNVAFLDLEDLVDCGLSLIESKRLLLKALQKCRGVAQRACKCG